MVHRQSPTTSTAEVATLKIQLETDYMKVHLLSSTNCLHQPREDRLVKLPRFVNITTNSLFADCVMTNKVCKARPQRLPGGQLVQESFQVKYGCFSRDNHRP